MNPVVRIVVVAVTGIVLGLFATWITMRGLPGAVSSGVWVTNLTTGSPASDPYTRARVALHGLFALNRNETIYYTATKDDGGERLDGKCRYELRGRDPNARWWSITAYGGDDFLIANPQNIYSVSATSVVRGKDGSFSVAVGGARGPGANWIPAGDGAFSLTLRLYNPGPEVALDPSQAALPSLKRIGCP
ncbi:MAG TPA: DUF1214 domain-containing protein [Rhizomicrobium sp.]|nr:DUF1214 domain-containing protein [Rhizomicrobium sp.]